ARTEGAGAVAAAVARTDERRNGRQEERAAGALDAADRADGDAHDLAAVVDARRPAQVPLELVGGRDELVQRVFATVDPDPRHRDTPTGERVDVHFGADHVPLRVDAARFAVDDVRQRQHAELLDRAVRQPL